ncbi:ankyrin repeat domain-containing protein [Dactylosporangium sp. NPDC049742]|uniref:ankyrin repeat domain-containing protein n=1 Tax=Dactylosporangium sp. NPDC049742 TaxID=3154737 RepID=UPI00341583A1
MIAECTQARERGDWRAACAAARVTVAFDDAGPVAELLAGFAPDLLRWHLPRALDGTAALVPGMRFVLAPDGPVTADTVVLGVRSPDRSTSSQRLVLHAVRVRDMAEGPVFAVAPHMWDARRASGLGAAVHGATRAERVVEDWISAGWLIDGTDTHRWAYSNSSGWSRLEMALLSQADPLLAARELRCLAAQFGQRSWELRPARHKRWPWPDRRLMLEVVGDANRLTRDATTPSRTGAVRADLCLHPALLCAPVDAELVQRGRLDAADLHPLVRSALFPAARPGTARPAAARSDAAGSGVAGSGVAGSGVAGSGVAGSGVAGSGVAGSDAARAAEMVPAGFAEGERVRVRCGAVWHSVSVRGGRLELLDHTDAERRREHALRSFGGTMSGCFRTEAAWHDGEGVLPRRLRAYRQDLWRRMTHGGGKVVLALLDAGMDPRVRDVAGQTLLHRMHQFEHADLLPRLLAERVDVNPVSRRGSTPMCDAVVHNAPADLIETLSEAGAIPHLSRLDPSSWPVQARGQEVVTGRR